MIGHVLDYKKQKKLLLTLILSYPKETNNLLSVEKIPVEC